MVKWQPGFRYSVSFTLFLSQYYKAKTFGFISVKN